eukprot:m.416254 g.416254  ORF g.416254 m.416254 type:complete len:552 (+) comp56611_c0_seq15:393-2048(+)
MCRHSTPSIHIRWHPHRHNKPHTSPSRTPLRRVCRWLCALHCFGLAPRGESGVAHIVLGGERDRRDRNRCKHFTRMYQPRPSLIGLLPLDLEELNPARRRGRDKSVSVPNDMLIMDDVALLEYEDDPDEDYEDDDLPLVKDSEEKDSISTKRAWIIRLSLFFCGIGSFARCEAFLLQSQLYNICFEEGLDFYAKASAALFLPGVLVLVLQSKYDHAIDKRFGTLRANYSRVIIATIATVAVTLGFILALFKNPSLVPAVVPLYFTLVVVGICTSLTYGAFAQIVALVPERFHYYFFTGTMCPFFVYIPVNVATGNLCSVHSNNSTIAGDMMTTGSTNSNEVLVFYSVACLVTVLGFVSLVATTKACYKIIARKDLLLRNKAAIETSNVSLKHILLRIKWESTAYAISVVTSLYVASKYSSIPAAQFDNLETLLLYEYYVASAIGMILTEWKAARQRATLSVLMIVAIARIAGIVFVTCIAQPYAYIHLSSDWIVLAVNCVFMATGGFLFSVLFSRACSKFEDEPSKARASTILNIIYYVSMSVSVVCALVT